MSTTALPPISLDALIVRTPGTCGARPRIAGSRIRVQDIFVWHEFQGQSVDEIVAGFPQLTHAQVHGALSYYFLHADEIRQEMDDDDRFVAEFRLKTGPGPLEQLLARRSADAANH